MLPNWYNTYKNLIDNSVEKFLVEYFKSEKNPALETIKDGTLYACKWWKRVRSILALEFFNIFSWKNSLEDKDTIKFCIAIELLHSYSLVHDDLPAMDNDILRRWESTTWKKYGETNAILVWDLLNSLSFELLSEIWNTTIIKYFWKAVWLNGMLWWQVLDLFYEKNPEELTLEYLIETHNKKTGALIKISILWALILANKERKEKKLTKSEIEKYEIFAEKLGLAFQIKDDILDVEWTKGETGKSIWWEEKWFVYFLGLEKSKKYLQDLLADCREIIGDLGSEKLEFLVDYIWNRKR